MLRRYETGDKDQLLSIISDLTPSYFAYEECDQYKEYLEVSIEDYFIILDNGKLVGGGGINYLHDLNTARLSWDLIARTHQGKGLGKTLTKHRIETIRARFPEYKIEVRTSQLSFGFYKQMQFETIEIKQDYWAKGFDLYHMVLKEQIC